MRKAIAYFVIAFGLNVHGGVQTIISLGAIMAGRGPNIALGWILFFFLMTVAKLTQFYTAERYLCSFLEYAKKHGVDALRRSHPRRSDGLTL